MAKSAIVQSFIYGYPFHAISLVGGAVGQRRIVSTALPTWLGPLVMGLVIAASLMVMLLTRKNRQGHRHLADDFAEAWLILANRLLPRPLQVSIFLKRDPKTGDLLPWEQQNSYLQSIRKKALSPVSDAEYKALTDCLDRLAERTFRSRTDRYQFYLPLELYAETMQCFLSGCADLTCLQSERSFTLFNDFLIRQQDIRNGLLRRISREFGGRFWALNQAYDLDPKGDLSWERNRLGLPERRKQRQEAKLYKAGLKL